MFKYSILLLMITQASYAKAPDWATDLPKTVNRHLIISCQGDGPDKSLAYRQAMDECRSIAADQLGGNFKVESMSLETEQTAGFHQEVAHRNDVTGLTCTPTKNYEEANQGSYQVYLKCDFDTAKAKIVEAKPKNIKYKPMIASDVRKVIVSTVPHCQSLIIQGKISRMVKCDSNPQALTLGPDDKEIIIRADGYQPQHVSIDNRDRMEFYLERN